MKLEKALKNLDAETVSDIQSLSVEDLKQRVVQANQAMQQVQTELENNAEYQEILENKKAMELGKKEVFKRQNSIICLALNSIEEKGKV